MQEQLIQEKQMFAVFLDIDGVFNREDKSYNKINQIVMEKLGGEGDHTSQCKDCLTCKTAEAFLFEKSAISSFEKLIEKMAKIANVHIIISSTWRKGYSINELKQIFNMYNFSRFFMDKTTESVNSFEIWKDYCVLPHFDISKELPLEIREQAKEAKTTSCRNKFLDRIIHLSMRCRASEIKEWIDQHPGYIGYLVIDDRDKEAHLSPNFGDRFISTYHEGNYLLNPEDTKKAYRIFHQLVS